ncbi:group II intron maturase-specific domain-containing protein [Clostridium beijerinckii]|uniref:Group II intron-encoded protein LtrA n=1 Tax=Clostridium beijerinckii TaxID=1520 RepID=A0A1S8S1D1_CLOBE|nr:group II intron maturase-specific domain-containing protein [Clostridium beijerinckii]NRY63019.1 hypothetical protein [Clostridium beijerinckii]OOM59095.1 group II intron-encoded protein LtrA [Clostridium beijerinckii]
MDKSKKLHRKQKTQYRDQLMEGEVELQGKSKVPSNSMVLPNRESVNDETFDTSRLLEEVLERNNMLLAFKRVISNKGSHGVDRMKTDELREHIKKHWENIKAKLLESKYNPSSGRRKEISKPDGGVRLLGISTVQNRLIQQAIAQVLSKIYDPLFSENSFGFRPRRGAQDAIYFSKNGAEIRIHEKSIKRFKEKVKFYTNRNKGISMEYRLLKLNQITRGLINYYGVANARGKLVELDKWIRRRLRACIWKQWKKISTKQRNLVKLGINEYKAWEYANTRKDYWRISNSPILSKSLNNKYLETLGFISLTQTYQMMH